MSQQTQGTVDLVHLNIVVQGTGTSFRNAKKGDLFTRKDSGVFYTIASDPAVDNSLTLQTAYAGANETGVEYIIHSGFTPNAGLPLLGSSDLNTAYLFNRAMQKIDENWNTDGTLKGGTGTGGGGTGGTTGPLTIARELKTATLGQTVFNLAIITYTPANHNLMVAVDGRTIPSTDYSETSGNTVTFLTPLAENTEVEFISFTGGGGSGGTTVIVGGGGGGPKQVETKVATVDDQTIFDLATITYVVGSNNLMVFVDGQFMTPGTDYAETNTTRITFTAGVPINAEVTVVLLAGAIWPTGTFQNPIKLGAGSLWMEVATGKVRIKTSGAPASDTDGIIVGVQT